MLQKNTVYLMMTSTLWMVKALFFPWKLRSWTEITQLFGRIFLEDNAALQLGLLRARKTLQSDVPSGA